MRRQKTMLVTKQKGSVQASKEYFPLFLFIISAQHGRLSTGLLQEIFFL